MCWSWTTSSWTRRRPRDLSVCSRRSISREPHWWWQVRIGISRWRRAMCRRSSSPPAIRSTPIKCCALANSSLPAAPSKKSNNAGPGNVMNAFEVTKPVRLTEKGPSQSEKFNQYTVVADRRANKIQIRQAVEELFKVNVTDVRTINVHGKWRRRRTTRAGKDPDWKKAIVTLKKGDKIVLT